MVASFVTDRLEVLSLGLMRRLFAIAALMLALFFAAAPAEAAWESGGEVAIAAGDVQGAAGVLAGVTGGHCQHVPCSDTTHNHMPGGCTGHSFVPAFTFETPRVAVSRRLVAFANEISDGRTLMPPVPPPLA